MTLAEKIIAGLEKFRDDLESGERITATCVQRCPCSKDRRRSTAKCRMCNGKGYLFDAVTVLPPKAKR